MMVLPSSTRRRRSRRIAAPWSRHVAAHVVVVLGRLRPCRYEHGYIRLGTVRMNRRYNKNITYLKNHPYIICTITYLLTYIIHLYNYIFPFMYLYIHIYYIPTTMIQHSCRIDMPI